MSEVRAQLAVSQNYFVVWTLARAIWEVQRSDNLS